MTGNEIRAKYLEFFASKGHTVLPSASLVPVGDPTLLWINAGMAPLKPYFEGRVAPPNLRLASSQKCIRTNDIENVGRTPRHHTFFEMLGNFSIGDYFKREAITWSWEFITEWLKLPAEKIWVTVHPSDDEARQLWKEIAGLPDGRIVDDEGNFWDIGPGPCGPNTEIYYDRGEKYGCGKPDCGPLCECGRYLEFWNNVFTQFNHNVDGTHTPLPKKNIDTGMGLERMASIMQDVATNFETDLLWPMVEAAARMAGVKYVKDGKTDMALHLIADHSRAVLFAIADGASPSNEGRGYVIRRLLRRAVRYGKVLGIDGAFLYKLVPVVVGVMGEAYPEIAAKADFAARVIRSEEERFLATLNEGTNKLNDMIEIIQREGRTIISGAEAFLLADTYGFPLDLTEDFAREHGLTVDRDGFEQAMTAQRERARAARKGAEGWEASSGGIARGLAGIPATSFVGYETLSAQASVIAIFSGEERVSAAQAGEEASLVLDTTPFYAESGGQVADRGRIATDSGEFAVESVKRLPDGKYIHFGRVATGSLEEGQAARSEVDALRRRATERNHSATHLLHKALREVLGDHVHQTGSLVEPERLRFDFSHFSPVAAEELVRIEDIVNRQVLADLAVTIVEKPIAEARAEGATALFGEKYGDVVRVVTMGEWSKELCGGTHVRSTSEIGLLKIVSEGSVGSGLRRIEAVTGSGVMAYLRSREAIIDELAAELKANADTLATRVRDVLAELRDTQRELEQARGKAAAAQVDPVLARAVDIGGVKVIAAEVSVPDMDALRSLGDRIREQAGEAVIVLGSPAAGGKCNLVAMVTGGLGKRGLHAGNIVREVAKVTGGGGGGRPDMAQAGGKDAGKLSEALALVPELVRTAIGA
ncbi:MAG: alanine--tRNA ligase [Chloroflexota bacterium]